MPVPELAPVVLGPSLTPMPGVALFAFPVVVVNVPAPVLVDPPGAVLADVDDAAAAEPDPLDAPDDAEPDEPPAPPAPPAPPPPPPPPPPWAKAPNVENVIAQAVAIASFLVIMIRSWVAGNKVLAANAFPLGKSTGCVQGCDRMRGAIVPSAMAKR